MTLQEFEITKKIYNRIWGAAFDSGEKNIFEQMRLLIKELNIIRDELDNYGK